MISFWKEKYPDLEVKTIIDWIRQGSLSSLNHDQLVDFMADRYAVAQGGSVEAFKDRWHVDPETGNKLSIAGSEPKPEPPKPKVRKVPKVPEELKEPEGDVDDMSDEEADAAVEKLVEEFKAKGEGIDVQELGFENPDLNNVEDSDDDIDDSEPEVISDSAPKVDFKPQARRFERPRTQTRPRDEFITEDVTPGDYRRILRPFGPFFDFSRHERSYLRFWAQRIDPANPPPWFVVKDHLLNNGVKDLSNIKVLLDVPDPELPDRVMKSYTPLPECRDIARRLAQQNFLQASVNDYDAVCESYEGLVTDLTCLVFLLEVYVTKKEVSPFQMSIPKQALADIMVEEMSEVKGLLVDQVIETMVSMRGDLKNELKELGENVKHNLGSYGGQIADAIQKVAWKVKTDIDQTNLEDLKRSMNWVSNLFRKAEGLGAPAYGLNAMLVVDILDRVVVEDFKVDKIKAAPRYSVTAIARKFKYPQVSYLIPIIKKLITAKIIRMYEDKTLSLNI